MRQHFLVLPATHVQSHQSAVSHSLAPQIEALIVKAENAIASQSKKVSNLEERFAIVQSARVPPVAVLPTLPAEDQGDRDQDIEDVDEGDSWGKSRLDGLEIKELTVAQRRKVIMLKGKRERLERERRELMGDED
jgi:DASH complex subunit SPC19